MSFYKSLQADSFRRYGRQLALRNWGPKAQQKIQDKSVLVVGAGGLGSPACLYLAAAGIGKLGIVDGDSVELTNLHRQIIHSEKSIGSLKAFSADKACHGINSTCKVQAYPCMLDAALAAQLVQEYDVILDGSDNLRTRYILNDAAFLYNKPLVSGSALRWEGQLCVYGYNSGPCMRCVFPLGDKPQEDESGSCEAQGVLGPVVGVIGVMQALEVMKICGDLTESVLSNRMLIFDALNPFQPWRSIKLRSKQSNCSVCGDDSSIKTMQDFDYVRFFRRPNFPKIDFNQIVDSNELALLLLRRDEDEEDGEGGRKPIKDDEAPSSEDGATVSNCYVIDVRPAAHFACSHVKDSINWPIDDVIDTHDEAGEIAFQTAFMEKIRNAIPLSSTLSYQEEDDADEHQIPTKAGENLGHTHADSELQEKSELKTSTHTPPKINVKILALCRRGNDSAIFTKLLTENLAKSRNVLEDVEVNRRYLVKVFNVSGGLQALSARRDEIAII